MESKFVIGKKYRPTDAFKIITIEFKNSDRIVTCKDVGSDGDMWTTDVTYEGNDPTDGIGWCVGQDFEPVDE